MDENKHVRFVLEMDGIRSVVDATLPESKIAMAKVLIEQEIKSRFSRPVTDFCEDRFSGKEGGILTGRYLIAPDPCSAQV